MNLMDFRRTSIARATEFVRREAQRYGATIHHTELVGLIPQAAITDTAAWYLQLDGFTPDQVLENRLSKQIDAQVVQQSDGAMPFLDALASEMATPGGGAAAAYTAAEAAALIAKVAQSSARKAQSPGSAARFAQICTEMGLLRAELTRAIDQDVAAFKALLRAARLPQGSAAEIEARNQAIGEAAQPVCEIPLRVAAHALKIIEAAAELVATGNPNAGADAAGAAELARAALKSSAYILTSNIAWLQNAGLRRRYTQEMDSLSAQSTALDVKIQASFMARVNEARL
jgi:glutamate formiminotransferase/formiminotetrahydrofolate cyclodeaminase